MRRAVYALIGFLVAITLLTGLALPYDVEMGTPSLIESSVPDSSLFIGPGFMLDTRQWAPLAVEDGVLFCIQEDGRFTCATISPGSILLLPVAPDTTEVK